MRRWFELLILVLLAYFFNTLWGGIFAGDLNLIDEGQFAAWGNHMLHGKVLFKDIYVVYGPLFIYPVYLLFEIFGPSAFIVRFYLIFGAIVGIIAADQILKELKVRKIIRYVTAALLLFLPSLILRQSVGLVTILFIIYSLRNPKFWYWTGILSAISILVSQEIGICVTTLGLISSFCSSVTLQKKLSFTKTFFSVFLGLVTILIPFYFWSSREGWFGDYVNVTFDVLTSFSGINVPNGKTFPNLLPLLNLNNLFSLLTSKTILYYIVIGFYICTLGYIFITFFLRKFTKQTAAVTIITLFGIFIYVAIISRPGIAHFYFSIFPVIILGGFFFEKLIIALKEKKRLAQIVSILTMCFFVLFAIRLVLINRVGLAKTLSSYFRLEYRNIDRLGFMKISKGQGDDILLLQKFFKDNSRVGDYVFFFNDEPMLYMLVDRVNPTKFDLPFAATTIEKRLNIVSDLKNNKPKYIIEDTSIWAVDEVSNRKRLPEVYAYILENYDKKQLTKNIIIFVKKQW